MASAAATAPGAAASRWPRQLALLAGLWALTGLVFARDIAALVMIWWDSSTFNHILLMVPLIGWLVVQRAPLLRQLTPVGWWPGALVMLAGSGLWLAGEAAGIAMVRQFGVVIMVQGAVAAALGPVLVRGLAFPLAYGWLLVPFGEELVPLLQTITAKLSMVMLAWAGIPAHIEGIFITTPRGFYEVAEACSGARFLIAMGAYAVFAAHVGFVSWRRRIIFVTLALAATVLANAVRAWGTMVIGDVFGRKYAEGFDHLVYGWVFFGAVMIAVMAAAWRWFDRPPADPPIAIAPLLARRAGPATALPLAGLLALAALLAGPGWDRAVGQRQGELPAAIMPPTPPGWVMGGTPSPVWKARFDGADQFVQRRFTAQNGAAVDVAIAAFTHQAEGRELIGFGQGAADPDGTWTWASRQPAVAGVPVDRLFHRGAVLRDVAIWYIVDGQLVTDPKWAKLAAMRARLLGGDPRAAAVLVSSADGTRARAAIAAYLDAAGGAAQISDAVLKNR